MKTSPISSMPLEARAPDKRIDDRPGFKESLMSSMKEVNDLQAKAHEAMTDLSTGRSSNIHEAMLAIQKAEISFKMMMQVRNKIITAYQEIMRMSV